MARDYYETLGVRRDATTEEIKRAFRRVARETHPDANPGDPESETRFRAAAEAYEVLADPERRRRYDRGDIIDLSDLFAGFGGLDDLLRSVFGERTVFGGGAPRRTRGRDVLVRTELTLEEAAFGTEAVVEYGTLGDCEHCLGSGAEPGAEQVTCPDCGGSGQVRLARRSLFGTMMSVTPCRRCEGEGRLLSELCRVCGGSGTQHQQSKVTVEIPAGVSTGTRLRVSGMGESGGKSGFAGDLFVEVVVAEDPRFEREGDHLYHTARIGIAEASLGTRLTVGLIDGSEAEVEVPPGTQPGALLTLKGEGMTVLGRRARGDLFVRVEVDVPKDLTPEEEDLLRRWAELRGEKIDRPAST
jgi:molecular chaperone DnaJ